MSNKSFCGERTGCFPLFGFGPALGCFHGVRPSTSSRVTVTALDILICIYVKTSKLILVLSIKQALTILVLFALDISSEWGHLFRNKGKRDNFE